MPPRYQDRWLGLVLFSVFAVHPICLGLLLSGASLVIKIGGVALAVAITLALRFIMVSLFAAKCIGKGDYWAAFKVELYSVVVLYSMLLCAFLWTAVGMLVSAPLWQFLALQIIEGSQRSEVMFSVAVQIMWPLIAAVYLCDACSFTKRRIMFRFSQMAAGDD